MGLDNIPQPYPCEARGKAVQDKNGTIDCDATKCWFRDDTHVRGMLGTYCWFRGKCLVWALELMGEEDLAARCYKSLSSVRAGQFGRRLLRLAAALRPRPGVASHGKSADGAKAKKPSGVQHAPKPEISNESDFEEALRTIEEGGRWYSKVAELGSGVKTWS